MVELKLVGNQHFKGNPSDNKNISDLKVLAGAEWTSTIMLNVMLNVKCAPFRAVSGMGT